MANSVPVIISVLLTPDPAKASQPVLVSVAAADIDLVPVSMQWQSGAWPGNPA